MIPEASLQKGDSQRYKAIFRRIGKFQDYLHEMAHLVSNHAVKTAGLRDKNDEVARCLAKYTKVEEFSTTSKLSMAIVAELVATIGDHQDLAVQRVETLVLPNLSSYGRICKCIKADVLNAIAAKNRENGRRKVLKTLKKKADDPKYKKVVSDAERELERAAAETSRLCQLSQEQVIKFEHKRLMDLRESLGNFVKIQIATHAKSLELLSEAYKHIQSIDENGDLDIITSHLNIEHNGSKRKSANVKADKSRGKKVDSVPSQSALENRELSNHDSDTASTESWNSELIDRLEEVMGSRHSLHDDMDKAEHQNVRTGHNKKPSQNGKSDKHAHSSKHKLHEDYSNNNDPYASSKKESLKRSTKRQNVYDDDSEIHIQTKLHPRRPTTPPRAVTVPRKVSSVEDLSSQADIRFRNNKNEVRRGGPMTSPNSPSNRKPYYYSQSEEENSRQGSLSQPVCMQDGKRVSFQAAGAATTPASRSRRKNGPIPKTEMMLGPTEMWNAPGANATQTQVKSREAKSCQPKMLFPPVKSSLKNKYC